MQQSVSKLDVACGLNKQVGFKGIDISPDSQADIFWDLNEYPWPIKANTVKQVFCSHYVEHIPHWRPGWDRDGWWLFFDELYRIMKVDGTAEFHHPYVMNTRAFWDPTHVRFIHEQTWYYLGKQWRQEAGLGHYPVECDFPDPQIDVMGVPNEYLTRNIEQQNMQRTHYWNVFGDLRVVLKKR